MRAKKCITLRKTKAMKTMKKLLFLILPLVLIVEISAQGISLKGKSTDMLEITILYDNYVCIEGTQSDWGFSCLIETDGQNILFDTGTKPDLLYSNIDIVGVDMAKVDQIFISHNHHDHVGGLTKILSEKSNIPVHLPHLEDNELSDRVSSLGSAPKSSLKPYEISNNIWSSGTMGKKIPEHCIVVDHEKGLIVIVGCSHPGISDMLEKIKKDFRKDIYAVMGGFHLMQYSDKQIDGVVEEFNSLGIEKCGCTHCTGEKQIQQFREAYGKDFIEMGTGRKVIFN